MKKLSINNPVDTFVSQFALKPPDIPSGGNQETIENTGERKTVHIQDRPKVDKNGKELKRKRYNLLLLPSIYSDIEKIAYVKKIKPNEAINQALVMYRDANRDKLVQYTEIEKLKTSNVVKET
jgi:hypothetical protein